jgi:hypothetical protein
MDSRQWWNGRWGRLARREIFVGPADGQWVVELRRGGEGGRSRTRTFASEAEALDWVENAVLEADGGWRQVDSSRSRRVAMVARTAG